MNRKWFMPSALIVVMLASVALSQSCQHKVGEGSRVLESDVARAQTIIRIFRRLIGRDPSQAEIQSLMPATTDYAGLVKTILDSPQFVQDGFYNVNRERLVLNREGSGEWLRNSYGDFCSLKLEMSDMAREDRSGKGFWETLRYKERWVRIASLEGFGDVGMNGCYMGTTIKDLVKAQKASEAGEELAENAPVTEQLARRCVEQLQWGFFDDVDDPQAKFTAFMAELSELPEADQAKGFVSRPEAEAFLVRQIRRQLGFTGFGDGPEEGEPLKLVKENGRPVVVRELGSLANQQCRFVPISLEQFAWRLSDINAGGFFPDPDQPAPAVEPPMDQPVLQTADSQGPLAVKADGSAYIKVEMPTYPGVHANPYWLARHPTKAKNKHLHRARAMYFSYFCAEVNPDAANFEGGPVSEVPEPLRPYFAEDDVHAQGSTNCFNCHAKIQPIANFFGQLSWGRDYAPTVDGPQMPDNGPISGQWAEIKGQQSPFDRPGGIWEGSSFYSMAGGPDRGTAGLAHAMSRYPLVKSCIVDATWAALVGRESPLFDEERKLGLAAFESQGQPASMSRLIEHFMTQNARGVAYFSKGEPAFAAIRPTTGYVCPESADDAHRQRVFATLEGNTGKCSNCHSGEFFTDDNKFSIDHYFDPNGGAMDDDTPEGRGRLIQNLYCRLYTNKMPPPSTGAILDQQTRGDAWCYFMRLRDKLADAGTIPAALKGKACPGAPAAQAVTSAPHAVIGQPQQ